MDNYKVTPVKNKLVLAATLVLSATSVNAKMIELGNSNNNFTMLDPNGGRVGGANDVAVMWDGTFNTSVETAVSNMTISSQNPFFSNLWTARDVKVFSAGSYTFEACPGAVVNGFAADGSKCNSGTSTPQTMVVGQGEVGVHMLFDWSGNKSIDVVNVWDMNAIWGFGINNPADASTFINAKGVEVTKYKNQLDSELSPCDGIGRKADLTTPECTAFFATEWLFTSTDPDGNGVPGSGMVDGPFVGFNANFNIRPQVSSVPVPAAAWLMVSGLFGFLGFAHRHKQQR